MPKASKKKPAICTDPGELSAFGFKMSDIVRTPLGITGTVVGVKFENPDIKETGRVWVKYENGQEAPLEPKLGAGHMSQLGYRRCSDADHIKRDVGAHVLLQKEADKQRAVAAEILYCKENGLPIPPDLMPPVKEKKKRKEGDDKKKKKK